DSHRGPAAAAMASGGVPHPQIQAGGVTPDESGAYESNYPAADYPGGPVRPEASSGAVPQGRLEEIAAQNVKARIWTQTQARDYVEKARFDMAAARANKMMLTTPQALIDLGQQEEAEPHSTYLSALDPVTRGRLLEAATNRQKSIANDAYIQEQRHRQEVDR